MKLPHHFTFAATRDIEEPPVSDLPDISLSPYPMGFILTTATVGLQTDAQSLPETFVTGGTLSIGVGNATAADIVQRKIWTGMQFVDLDSEIGAAILALRPTITMPTSES